MATVARLPWALWPRTRLWRGLHGVALAAWLSGCGDGAKSACVDLDLDGLGQGCAAGLDCDDGNPLRTDNCDVVPAADCVATPTATGCPCLFGTATDCYGGPTGTAGLGICHVGRAICVNAHWGACQGEVTPTGERCDGLDQSCDGRVDDGVQSPCGDCAPGCNGGVWGESDAPFTATNELSLTRDGALTLAERERVVAPFVWIANSAEGTVSKIDAVLLREVARYRVGDEPSRVAVDHHGDAWIANRAFGGQSTLVKVAGERSRCIDRGGDGIDTSSGGADVLPAGADDCVLLDVPVGGPLGVARALAIDGNLGLDEASGGDAWVGLHDAEEVIAIDGILGTERERIATPGFAPYAASFDRWGTLWLASRDGHLARVDLRARPAEVEVIEAPLPCYLFYSLAIDGEGDLFLTGFSCDDVVRYRPLRGTFHVERTPESPRGLGLMGGALWVSHTDGRLSRVRTDTLDVEATFDLSGDVVTPLESIGVGVLPDLGQVWIASSGGGEGMRGVATAFDANAGSVIGHVEVGDSPHTQGDLTGGELVAEHVPAGEARHVFEGCPLGSPTEWRRLHVAADAGSTGSVEIAVRRAETASALDGAMFVVLGRLPDQPAPYALALPSGGVVEVRVRLATSGRGGVPRVRRVGLEWQCSGPI